MPDSAIRRLLEFDNQVQRDRDQNPVFLHRRDRRFALDCHNQGVSPGPDRWLEHVRRLSRRRPTDDPLKFWRRVTTGFALAGLVAGTLAMLGLLFYDGGQRINLTVILAFVLLQCILAVVTTVQAFAGWQPWRWLLRKFAVARPSGALRTLQPLLMARAAHTGGLAFGVAGLITLLVLVVIQDLAFGWSTTLNTGTDSYYRMLSAIAHTLAASVACGDAGPRTGGCHPVLPQPVFHNDRSGPLGELVAVRGNGLDDLCRPAPARSAGGGDRSSPNARA